MDKEENSFFIEYLIINSRTGVNKIIVNSDSRELSVQRFFDEFLETQMPVDSLNIDSSPIHVRCFFRGVMLDPEHFLSDYGLTTGSNLLLEVSSRARQLPESDLSQQDEPEERGFERLRQYGFSPEEIHQFRSQFHNSHNQRSGFMNPESPEELQRAEEEWLNEQTPENRWPESNSNISGEEENPFGSSEDLFIGLLMGFFLGLMSILWLPDHSFSMKKKFGILTGFGISVTFGFLRFTFW